MPKRIRENSIQFDQNGHAIIELDGLFYKWNVPENLKGELSAYADEIDVSIIVTVNHKFFANVKSLRTNKIMATEEVEMI